MTDPIQPKPLSFVEAPDPTRYADQFNKAPEVCSSSEQLPLLKVCSPSFNWFRMPDASSGYYDENQNGVFDGRDIRITVFSKWKDGMPVVADRTVVVQSAAAPNAPTVLYADRFSHEPDTPTALLFVDHQWVVADFNGDGKLDIGSLSCQHDPRETSLRIFLQQ